MLLYKVTDSFPEPSKASSVSKRMIINSSNPNTLSVQKVTHTTAVYTTSPMILAASRYVSSSFSHFSRSFLIASSS